MREIKFRAWDKKLKLMIPVVAIKWDNGEEIINDTPERVILQYTGLKDSYVAEEYFGDIIQENDGTIRVIEDGRSAVLFRNPQVQFDNHIKYFWELKPHKVIGNIYENPELLKE